MTCIDVDGDGYGTGSTCTGPDADDNDSTVHTGAQGITKYGTLKIFLLHLGYSPTNFWYLATTGSDSNTCHDTNGTSAISTPCATFAHIRTSLAANDLVLWRAGTYTEALMSPGSGSSGNPIVFMAYPGESVLFDENGTGNTAFETVGQSYLTFDGFKATGIFGNNGFIDGGTLDTASVAAWHHITVRHNECYTACGLGGVSAFNGLHDILIEYNSFHDNACGGGSCQHGIYLGSRALTSQDITVRRNLLYGEDYNGVHLNGRMSNVAFDQNVVYNTLIKGISFQNGVTNSFIRGNLSFNNASGGIELGTYNGNEGLSNCGPGANAPCTCAPQNDYAVCPYSETGNVIENNVVYQTGKDYTGGTNNGSYAIVVAHFPGGLCTTSTCTGTAFGSNTFRNNIVVNYGFGGQYPSFIYYDNSPSDYRCGTDCASWLSSTVFNNNIGFQSDGSGGTGIIGLLQVGDTPPYGWQPYTCTQLTPLASANTNCSVADPKFVAASITYYNSAATSFDFHLQSTSPAKYTGTATGIPNYDLAGRAFADTTPSMGALEIQPWSQGWTDLTGAKISTSICPADGASGSVQNGGSAYPYQTNCPHVIRAWNSAILRQAPGKPVQLCIWGGGHTDYGGNEMYCLNINLITPTMTRINNPSQVTQTTYNTCPALNGDGSANSVHTYGGIFYHPALDSMYKFHGGTYCGNGTGNHDTELFNIGTTTWTAKDPVNCSVTCTVAVGSPIDPTTLTSQVDAYTVYAPWTGNMLTIVNGSSSAMMEYNPTGATQNGVLANQYILRSASQPGIPDCFGSNCTTANITLDTNLQEVLIMGAGIAYKIDVSVGGTFTVIDLSTHTSGCLAILNGDAPGLAYRPVDGLIYAYASNGGSTLYSISGLTKGATVDTLTCTAISSFTGGPTSGSNNTGMYSRFSYFAPLDTFAVVNDFNQDAFVFQPNAGGTPVCLITPTSLPSGTVSVSYSQTLTETNCGTSTFSISSGSLPTGLSGCSSGSGPTCTITGTPTTPGTYSFTVAFDTATDPLSIVIASGAASGGLVLNGKVLSSGQVKH